MIVTTSWDDGHPLDHRVADLLARHGLKGTFYVPNRNIEGHDVMSEAKVRSLSQGFEIGGHSHDHVVLTSVPAEEALRQIVTNRQWIEDVTGQAPPGFCYVQGRYNPSVKAMVKQAGYRFARTVKNLDCGLPEDPFEIPTTLQVFDHPPTVFLKNFLKGPVTVGRARLLAAALRPGDLVMRVDRMMRHSLAQAGCFHIWGHSWEIDAFDLWGELDAVFGLIAALGPAIVPMTNGELAARQVALAEPVRPCAGVSEGSTGSANSPGPGTSAPG